MAPFLSFITEIKNNIIIQEEGNLQFKNIRFATKILINNVISSGIFFQKNAEF